MSEAWTIQKIINKKEVCFGRFDTCQDVRDYLLSNGWILVGKDGSFLNLMYTKNKSYIRLDELGDKEFQSLKTFEAEQ